MVRVTPSHWIHDATVVLSLHHGTTDTYVGRDGIMQRRLAIALCVGTFDLVQLSWGPCIFIELNHRHSDYARGGAYLFDH